MDRRARDLPRGLRVGVPLRPERPHGDEQLGHAAARSAPVAGLRGRRHRDAPPGHRHPHPAPAQPARPGQGGGHARPLVRGTGRPGHRRGLAGGGVRRPRRALRPAGCPHRRVHRGDAGPVGRRPRLAHGEFLSFDDVSSNPKPTNGRVPIHIGGHSRAAAERAGRLGDGFFPGTGDIGDLVDIMRQTAAAAGRDPEAIEVSYGNEDLVGAGAGRRPAGWPRLGVDRCIVPSILFLGDTAASLEPTPTGSSPGQRRSLTRSEIASIGHAERDKSAPEPGISGGTRAGRGRPAGRRAPAPSSSRWSRRRRRRSRRCRSAGRPPGPRTAGRRRSIPTRARATSISAGSPQRRGPIQSSSVWTSWTSQPWAMRSG